MQVFSKSPYISNRRFLLTDFVRSVLTFRQTISIPFPWDKISSFLIYIQLWPQNHDNHMIINAFFSIVIFVMYLYTNWYFRWQYQWNWMFIQSFKWKFISLNVLSDLLNWKSRTCVHAIFSYIHPTFPPKLIYKYSPKIHT